MATEQSTTEADSTETDRAFVPFIGRFFPESLALSVLLAFAAMLVTIPYLEPLEQLELFTTGFYDLFVLQMALILYWVLSATVVEAKPVGALFDRIADVIPTNQTAIIYATGVVALAFGWVNWALGLLGGVYVGRKLCRQARNEGVSVHYPLVLTAGLLSLVLANQGPSSPGALLMADGELAEMTGFLADAGALGMSEFLLAPANLLSSVVLIATLPLLLVALAPDAEADRTEIRNGSLLDETIAETFEHYTRPSEGEWTAADYLEQSRTISMIAVIIGFGSIGLYFATGGTLTLFWLLFSLMILGLLVHVRPMAFRSKTTDATRWANHVAIPFMLYAVVFALLAEAGLYETIGTLLEASAVGPFVAALGIGLLVPDPASVWVIVGPALVAAEADLLPSIVAVMYGAGLSNLWLGFLFLGILSIDGFDWQEFLRYAAMVSLYVVVVVVVSITVL